MYKTQLDSIRFLAFLVVLFKHAGWETEYAHYWPVNMFFVISGFLITRILISGDTGKVGNDLGVFYARRTLRVFPLYYATLLFLFFVGYPSAHGQEWNYLSLPVWQFTYTTNVRYTVGGILGENVPWHHQELHLWSLCVEEQFYLLYPLLFLFTPRRARFPLLAVLLVLSIILRVALYTAAIVLVENKMAGDQLDDLALPVLLAAWGRITLPFSGELILWGCVAGYLEHLTKAQGRALFGFPAGALIALGLGVHLGGTWLEAFLRGVSLPGFVAGFETLNPDLGPKEVMIRACIVESFRQTCEGITFALIVFGLWRTDNRWLLRVLTFAPLAYLGKISYGLYVFHNFAYDLTGYLVSRVPPAWVTADSVLQGVLEYLTTTVLGKALAALSLTTALAVLSWHLMESPINNLKRFFPYGKAPFPPKKAPLPLPQEVGIKKK